VRPITLSSLEPVLLTMLREGRIHLSGIALLAPVLTPQNRAGLLKRATHKSKEEIRRLVADQAPRPDALSTIRKLPTRAGTTALAPVGPLCPDTVGRGKLLMDNNTSERSDTLAVASGGGATPGLDLTTRPPAPARPATVEPLGDNRYRDQYTASAQARDRLQRLRSLMRSTVPDGDLARIIDEAVREKLERLEARRFGRKKTPRKTLAETDTTPSSRHVPAAVRRAVHARDKGQCTSVDRHGRRCNARDRLSSTTTAHLSDEVATTASVMFAFSATRTMPCWPSRNTGSRRWRASGAGGSEAR
jgi:hypothetical protein